MDTDQPITKQVKSYLTTGVLFVVPVLVTVGILLFTLQFLLSFIAPVTDVFVSILGVGQTAAVLLIFGGAAGSVLLLGAAIETLPHGGRAANLFHTAAEKVPGVGQVYGSFREMSRTIADGEESFRDVKLVEYPSDGSYTMAFVTADTPPELEQSTGHTEEGMMSLFLPMGPNPVMGGFVIYVSRDRVYDVDLSVEEGLQAIITSGVAIGDEPPAESHQMPRTIKQSQAGKDT